MANPPLDPAVHTLIYEYAKQGLKTSQIRTALSEVHQIKVGHGTVCKFALIVPPHAVHYSGMGIRSDKKTGVFNWREWAGKAKEFQDLKHRASFSQDNAYIELGDGTHDVAICGFSDHHIGSWGCNYDRLVEMTDELMATKHLYIGLLGDYGQYSIKLRSVLEVSDNLMPPEQQTAFIQEWFNEIWKKVAFATFDNHGVERQEQLAGESSVKNILSKKVVYFNGLGHMTIKVGNQLYNGAVSHKFRGRSLLNPVHACMRYMRMEGHDREFAMMGDTHQPGMAKYTDGSITRVVTNNGSLQNNSGFGKRYFSLTTHPVFPLIVFSHHEHRMTPFWSIPEWLAAKGK